ncbi:hypothetical protein [Streptomyces sp. CBMA123]|uniref:hypothetical protein n=1 Tax=Streptomyces sp. CBMA123 TaxID=1896313 RepID=UPI001661CD51|nr:hypothetical protein [Streptomyces sp. CBMA123]MBD0688295.1 hypothetical protein [Streptomyces sp. CBMA123]
MPETRTTRTIDVANDAIARAGRALAEITDLAPFLTAHEAAEVLQGLTLMPGTAHQLAGTISEIGRQVAQEYGDRPPLWEPLLTQATAISTAAFRTAAASDAIAEAAEETTRSRAATAQSPALRAAGTGASVHLAPASAPPPHPRIVEPPHR